MKDGLQLLQHHHLHVIKQLMVEDVYIHYSYDHELIKIV